MSRVYASLEHYKETVEIDTPFGTTTLPLTWAEDMVGVIPVFKSREAALAYGGNNAKILVMELTR